MASTHKTPSAETVRRAVAIRARAWLRTHYTAAPSKAAPTSPRTAARHAPRQRPRRGAAGLPATRGLMWVGRS
jgi:hypothetical protein